MIRNIDAVKPRIAALAVAPRTSTVRALVTSGVLMAAAACASAQVAVDTFGPNFGFRANQASGFGFYQRFAIRFTPTQTTAITSLDMAAAGTTDFTMSIRTDQANVPSATTLWSATTPPSSPTPSIQILTLTGPSVTLTAGTPYWLVGQTIADTEGGGGAVNWHVSTVDALTSFSRFPLLSSFGTVGVWQSAQTTTPAAFRLYGITAACCNSQNGACLVLSLNDCTAQGLLSLGPGTTCSPGGPPTSPCRRCPADFNNSGTLTVQDIFVFLAAWFSLNPRADFNGTGGITVADIFDFLAAWFAGCP